MAANLGAVEVALLSGETHAFYCTASTTFEDLALDAASLWRLQHGAQLCDQSGVPWPSAQSVPRSGL